MKTNVVEKPATMTLAAVIKSAIEGAPSHAALRAAGDKLMELSAGLEALGTEIQTLLASDKRQIAKDQAADEIREKIDALTGQHILQAKERDRLRAQFFKEVTEAVRPERQKLVDRIAPALATLREASKEDTEFQKLLIAAGMEYRYVSPVSFMPVSSGGGDADADWAAARRQDGYTVA